MAHPAVEAVIERSFLLSASPARVYERLREGGAKRSREDLSEDTIKALLERKEPLIDLGLAQFVQNEECLRELFQRPDTGVRCAVLSNHRHFLRTSDLSSIFQGLGAVSVFQSEAELCDFLTDAPEGPILAFLMNPGLSEQLLERIFGRQGLMLGIPEERWHELVVVALRNPFLREKSPGERHQGERNEPPNFFGKARPLAWATLLNLPVTAAFANAIEPALREMVFAAPIPPVQLLSDAPNGASTEPISDRQVFEEQDSSRVGFLLAVLERWRKSENAGDDEQSESYFEDLRESIAARAVASHTSSLSEALRAHPDAPVRRGYYRAFEPSEIHELDGCYEKDGENFIRGAVENAWFFRKKVPFEVRRRMYQIASKHSNLGRQFEGNGERLSAADPATYEYDFVHLMLGKGSQG